VQRQQIKWFAHGAALSIRLGLFPSRSPGDRTSSCWGRRCNWTGWASASSGSGCGRSTGWSTAPWSTGCSPSCSAPSTPGWSSPWAAVGGIGSETPSW